MVGLDIHSVDPRFSVAVLTSPTRRNMTWKPLPSEVTHAMSPYPTVDIVTMRK